MEKEVTLECITLKLENISLSSGNGELDEEPVVFSQDSVYALECLPVLRKTSTVTDFHF